MFDLLLKIPDEWLLYSQYLLITGAGVGAAISFFSECIDKDKKITNTGYLAAIILIISISMQLFNAAAEYAKNKHKEQEIAQSEEDKLDKLVKILNVVNKTVGKISETQEAIQKVSSKTNDAAVAQASIQATENSASMQALTRSLNVIDDRTYKLGNHTLEVKHMTKDVSLKVSEGYKKYIKQDSPSIIHKSPSTMLLQLQELKALKLFRGNKEKVFSIKVNYGEEEATCNVNQEFLRTGEEPVTLNCDPITVRKDDLIKVSIETQVERKKFFGTGTAYFIRQFFPIALQTYSGDRGKATLFFDYPGGDNVDSKYSLFYKLQTP